MSELGLRLKNAREEKGFSIDELQTITKIQKRYLIAIEEGDFSRLPGDFYARAFVKSYADAVGIPSEILFEEHRDELPQPKRETKEIPPRIGGRSKPKMVRKRSKFAALLPTLIAIVFVVAVVVGIWYMGQDNEGEPLGVSRQDQQNDPSVDITDSVVDEDESDVEEEVEVEEEEAEPEPEPEPEQVLVFNETTDGNRSHFTLSNTDTFDVRMEFSGDSWIRLRDSANDAFHEGMYGNGDEESFDFSDETQISFHLGASQTAAIYINDELLEYPLETTTQHIIISFEPLEN